MKHLRKIDVAGPFLPFVRHRSDAFRGASEPGTRGVTDEPKTLVYSSPGP